MSKRHCSGPDPAALLPLLKHCDKWLIVINADPDAMSAAMALKRLMAHRVARADIAHVNEIKRPDNLAMIRLTRLKMVRLSPETAAGYDRFAIVDSQPGHHPDFAPYAYSIVIDHHPLDALSLTAPFHDIRPHYGATASILSEYLDKLGVRPGKLLATALLYGIKTDTKSFERPFVDADIRAFRRLAARANMLLLSKIARVEMDQSWLSLIAEAFRRMAVIRRHGLFVPMGRVDSPDLLVILADFFLKVRDIAWTVVCGEYQDRLVIILRGDGLSRDMGELAKKLFAGHGQAGGHKAMARAEIRLADVPGADPAAFVRDRLTGLPPGQGDKRGVLG